MLGQVATLRHRVTDIIALHDDVTKGAVALLEHLPLRAEPGAQETAPADVAVIGLACLLPKANSPAQYWENILGKVDAITEIPAHRWDWRLYFDADREAKDKIYSKWGGFLDDLAFDPTAYGMPPKSIESIDPMQLMGLEVARRTLTDAGYHTKPFDRERASVIIGASGGIGDVGMQYGLRAELPRFTGDLPETLAERLPQWTEDSFAGILPNVAAGRIANRLNFGGMNLTTDAACASSLAAVYQGVTELTAGRSDLVIAGGIDTVQGPFGYLCFSKTQALSPRGKCATFDSSGDGIVISEGIAMLALKRLVDAQRDGDRIYSVIKGVGASSDGSAKGMTAPLPAGQLRAMRRAYAMAGFGPSSVGLFEAHGTGTVAGDTAELDSTTRLLREESAVPRQAAIGSVKTMIGHTKATAGAAGLVKAALALHHRVLPPHGNVKTPNSMLADDRSPLYLLADPMPWFAETGEPRRAACSAFGFGGTNFHIVLEEYSGEYRDWLRPPAGNTWSAELLVWADTDRAALLTRLESFGAAIVDVDGLLMRDLAASLAARLSMRGQTLAIVARNGADLRAKLDAALAYLRGEISVLPAGVFYGNAAEPGQIAVLFSGQGSQYPNMLREAALHFECVGDAFTEADRALKGDFEIRFGKAACLTKFIFPRGVYGEAAKLDAKLRLAGTDVAQPALGAVETGLFRLVSSLGLRADMFAGHSYGEFVALHAAGVFDFDTLMQLSAARGRFIVDAASAAGAELGTMAAVNAPRELVENALGGIDGVILANHNAPLQSVISGTHAAVQVAAAKLRELGAEVTEIPVAAAFHSKLVEPAQQPLADLIESTLWSAASTPVYSNSTARAHEPDPASIKRQMAEHLVQPVEFVAQIETMYANGARIFLEIGPKAVLSRLVPRILGNRPHVAIGLDDGQGFAALLAGFAQLLCAGVKLDITRLFSRRDCRIGDPANPAALLRVQTTSKHAWMLNGSGARRASEPVKQIGVTVEQARFLAPQAPAAPAALERLTSMPSPSVTTVWRKDRSMDERRTPSGLADSSVISEYFETMRQFLETQERVMGAFLGDGQGLRSTRTRMPPINASRMAELAAAPAVVPAAKLHVPVAAPAAALRVTQPVVAPPLVVPPLSATSVTAAKPGAATLMPKTNGAGLTREKLLDALLGIVEEKTGYPRDMLGLDQNLEADLGIDSIKRVEVVGALLKLLPDGYREGLAQNRGKLNTQSTLNGMLDLITQAKSSGAVVGPFDLAGVGSKADFFSHPPRLVMRAQAEPITATMARQRVTGTFLLTRDVSGVTEALSTALRALDVNVLVVEPNVLASEARLIEFCSQPGLPGQISGIVHLAALGAAPLAAEHGPPEWRAAIQLYEKSFFLLLRELHSRLTDGAHVIAASALGGLFGRHDSATAALHIQGGAPGTLKSLLEERANLRVKAVDLDPARTALQLAADLMSEMELDGGRQEVGYPAGRRTIFITKAEAVDVDPAREAKLHDLVVLATGGARGITAEVLRGLAQAGNTLILTGRSRLPEHEASETATLTDASALRKYYVAQVRAGTLKLTPGEVQRRVQSVLDLREMRANISDLRAAGAAVEYHSVDVTDEASLRSLIDDVSRRHARIDGVVHGAGVIEDKLLVDKTAESWSRVVETKLIGLLLLQKLVNSATLRFFTVFSSVAGRYGNSGQSDYATANELMNRVCVALQARWRNRVSVSALCWGPWGPTKFGAGMVTPETEAKFEKRGVFLVSAALGRQLFKQELGRSNAGEVEVICGEGPWESQEAERGMISPAVMAHAVPTAAAGPAAAGPLLGSASLLTGPTGEKIFHVRVDSSRHLYLLGTTEGRKPVLTTAAALELMAEAARGIWPRWCLIEASEIRALKAVELDDGAREVQIHLSPPPYGSSQGFDVSASVKTQTADGKLSTHFRCVLRLEPAMPAAVPAMRAGHTDRTLTVQKAYGEWLPRSARLQVIEKIDGLSASGASAHVRATEPAGWLSDGVGTWVFDPALMEAAEQMLILWARAYRNQSVVFAHCGRIVRYRDDVPERLLMTLTCAADVEPGIVRGIFNFSDDQGIDVLAIEDFDSMASDRIDHVGDKLRAAENALA